MFREANSRLLKKGSDILIPHSEITEETQFRNKGVFSTTIIEIMVDVITNASEGYSFYK